MVGIHERSSREKIGAQSQAHAMHDEECRKYLQSVKRLITYAQRIYPTLPSLSLDFNSGFNGWDKESLLLEAGPYTRPLPSSPEPFLVTEATSSVHFSAQPETCLSLNSLNIAHKKCSRLAEKWTHVAHKKRLR